MKLLKYAILAILYCQLSSCKNKIIEPTNEITNKKQPNVLLIFTDDQQWNTIAALGNPDIITPNMDRLAKDAFVFNNAYCFGGNTGAVCIPSRNMLMSGTNFFRFEEDSRRMAANGEKPRKIHYTNPDWSTLPKTLKAGGYETYFREKSGSANNPVVRTQFDHFEDIHQVNALRTGRPANGIVNDAISFLNKERDTAKPFFMYLGVPAPHDPRWSLKQFRDMYDQDKMPLPENYKPAHPWDIGTMTIRDESLEKWPRTEDAIKRHLYDYYSVITAMDYDLGRLIDELERLELDENTIIIFTSDQGLAIGQHGLMGKQNIYEGTMKVPFLVKGPGIKKGHSDALIYIHDIFPTLCEYAGISIPEKLDGLSFAKITNEDEKAETRNALMLAYMDFQRSVRDNQYKLIHFPKINKSQLFDLSKDPNEINDLSNREEFADVKKRMFALLETERRAAGDIIDLFPKDTIPSEFVYPTKKLKTEFPAGGLAPEDPSYKTFK